jgi:hypothetical protein
MANHEENERDYPHWEELPGGGWRYWKDVPGKIKNLLRYVKIVDANKVISSFVQEIYNDEGKSIARHQKYPVDTSMNQ